MFYTGANQPVSDSTSTDGIILCPYCNDHASSLLPIESGMKLRLQTEANVTSIPDRVCAGCYSQLGRLVSKGAVLRAEQQVREQNRLMLWRNRVQLVKQAKQLLAQKNYADAAVAYEKYIRVLEIVYDVKPGELGPDHLRKQGRMQELTVVTSAYWDLMRIYDTHATYRDRQEKAAQKLANFVRFTPIFPQIMRKAETQTRQAKNPEVFKKFLKSASSNRPRCFIATAAYDGQLTTTVETLCRFRDEFLERGPLGRRLVRLYYSFSPGFAELLDRNPALKPAARKLLTRIAESKFIRNRLNP
jgi:uncharacterized membrane protein YkvA (DUF1232 family)